VLAALGTVLGRTRLMRLAGQAEAVPHTDTNYYWAQRVRVHVPIVTVPQVRFQCGGREVHMAAGECWIFDTWRRHNVLNPDPRPRIHLVSDTVGTAEFWDLVERAYRPHAPAQHPLEPERLVPWRPDAAVELELEQVNLPVVMSPWEQQSLIGALLDDLHEADALKTEAGQRLLAELRRFQRHWRALWARHGDAAPGWPQYRLALDELRHRVASLDQRLFLPNGTDAHETLLQWIVRPALNPDLARPAAAAASVEPQAQAVPALQAAAAPAGPAAAPAAAAGPRPQIHRPIFVVSTPRSGSTLLFETLARSPDLWTIGGESHALIEGIDKLDPSRRAYESNRLTEIDADPATAALLHERFVARMRDRDGKPLPADAAAVRLLERRPRTPCASRSWPRSSPMRCSSFCTASRTNASVA
jgi:hypothetical protein